MSKMRADPAKFINQAKARSKKVVSSSLEYLECLVSPIARAPSDAAKLRLMARSAALAASALITK